MSNIFNRFQVHGQAKQERQVRRHRGRTKRRLCQVAASKNEKFLSAKPIGKSGKLFVYTYTVSP